MFWFACCASSAWWTFNETEFAVLRHHTFERLIFAVCYSDHYPSCMGIPELTRRFAANLGNRSNLLVTLVNTADRNHIRHFRITGTPFILLVLGPKRKYWPKTEERDEAAWDRFIRAQTSPSLRLISNSSERRSSLLDGFESGGSSFHLIVPSENLSIVSELRALSRRHRIFGCTFTFELNETVQKPKLTVHRAPNCSTEFDGERLSEFVDSNKFGALHKYDLEEYLEATARSETLIFILVQNLDGNHRAMLHKIATNLNCEGLVTGWATTHESKRKILIELGINFSDLPALVYRSPKTHCTTFYKGAAEFVEESGFLRRAREGKVCNKTFYATFHEEKTHAEAMSEKQIGPKDLRGVPGFVFIAVYGAVGLSIVFLMRRLPSLGRPEKNIWD
jgi:hypothetical protein